MHDRNVCVTTEIGLVKSEYMRDSMYLHCCCQLGIMNLDALHTILHNEYAPDSIDMFVVRQDSDGLLNPMKCLVRGGDGETVSVAI